MIRRLTAFAALLLAPIATAAGQGPAPKQVLSIQPLHAMFEFLSAEYERSASKAVTWGIGGNRWGDEDSGGGYENTYTSGEVKVRYYPAGIALHGFSFGGAVGFSKISNRNGATTDNTTGASIAVLLEYQWILGEKQNFVVALGLGAKKLMVPEDEFSNGNVTVNYPTARISVGLAW